MLRFTRGNGMEVTLRANAPLLTLAYAVPFGTWTLTDEVSSMTFTYVQSDGSTPATSKADVAFVEFDLVLMRDGVLLPSTNASCAKEPDVKSLRFDQQEGSAMLIGVVFLIASTAVLLAAVQRMASTSISDSALHNDGIQALFIAESGLEHAAWRYNNGIACTALSGETGNVASGSYDILSGILVSGGCRIRVRGSVSSTVPANAANRVIEGVFSAATQAGGGVGAWSVGRRDSYELIINHDGSNWSRTERNSGIPDEDLFDISCTHAGDCWAVGEDDRGETLIHWDGNDWSRAGPYAGHTG